MSEPFSVTIFRITLPGGFPGDEFVVGEVEVPEDVHVVDRREWARREAARLYAADVNKVLVRYVCERSVAWRTCQTKNNVRVK